MRTFRIVLLMLMLVLAGCGGQPAAVAPPTSGTAPTSAPATAAPAPTAVAAAPTTVAEAPSPSLPPVSAAPQLPATVTDKDGATVTINSVDRIVSLTGDITEIVFALDLGPNVVGVDTSATYPPEETEKRANIGYQRALNAEGILALQPTLVIGDEAAGPPEVLTQIRDTGVPVALTADPPTMDAPAQKIRFVAQALGVPQRGEALIARLDSDLAAARAALAKATSPQPRVLFLYLRGTNVQQVAGSNTSADAMIVAAGAINAAAEAGVESFKPLSPEIVVAAQPDVLLLLEAGLESVGGIDGLLTIPGLADTPAGRDRHVVALDDLYLLGMGPRTGQALRDLVEGLHPELGR